MSIPFAPAVQLPQVLRNKDVLGCIGRFSKGSVWRSCDVAIGKNFDCFARPDHRALQK